MDAIGHAAPLNARQGGAPPLSHRLRGGAAAAAARTNRAPVPFSPASLPACPCSGMNNEEIDNAVQAAKRDMFSMRIKFAKREVSPAAAGQGGGGRAARGAAPTCSAAARLGSCLAGWLAS